MAGRCDCHQQNRERLKAVPARGHFPNEQAVWKCLYRALMSLDSTGSGRRRRRIHWNAR
jgi:hypothetical protein